MTIKEAKEIIERKQSSREQDIEKLLHNIHTITGDKHLENLDWFQIYDEIKNIMEKIEEARQDYNEYWRVLDTLDWFE